MAKKNLSFGLPLFMIAVRDQPGKFMAFSDSGKNMALVFTTLERAQAQLDSLPNPETLAIAGIPTPDDLLTFLRNVLAAKHTHLIFDMHPQRMTGRVIAVKQMLKEIEGQLPKTPET